LTTISLGDRLRHRSAASRSVEPGGASHSTSTLGASPSRVRCLTSTRSAEPGPWHLLVPRENDTHPDKLLSCRYPIPWQDPPNSWEMYYPLTAPLESPSRKRSGFPAGVLSTNRSHHHSAIRRSRKTIRVEPSHHWER